MMTTGHRPAESQTNNQNHIQLQELHLIQTEQDTNQKNQNRDTQVCPYWTLLAKSSKDQQSLVKTSRVQ